MSRDISLRALVAIDDSQSSVAVLEYLKNRRWPKDAEFLVISVAEPSEVDQSCAKRYPQSANIAPSLVRQHFLTEIVEYAVVALKESLQTDNIKPMVTEGDIAESIIRLAKKWNANAIFLGCRDKCDPLLAKHKSISEKVLRTACCSVIIVKVCAITKKSLTGEQGEESSNLAEVSSVK